MNTHARLAAAELMVSGAGAPSRPSWLRLLRVRLASWVSTCADCYAAAAAYDDLSRLSDTQLEHRGLSRDILARDVGGGVTTDIRARLPLMNWEAVRFRTLWIVAAAHESNSGTNLPCLRRRRYDRLWGEPSVVGDTGRREVLTQKRRVELRAPIRPQSSLGIEPKTEGQPAGKF